MVDPLALSLVEMAAQMDILVHHLDVCSSFSSSLVTSLWDSCGLFLWAEREISPYGRLLGSVVFLAATLSGFWWTAPGLVCRLAAVVVVAPFQFCFFFLALLPLSFYNNHGLTCC